MKRDIIYHKYPEGKSDNEKKTDEAKKLLLISKKGNPLDHL